LHDADFIATLFQNLSLSTENTYRKIEK